MREVLAGNREGHPRSVLAINMYCYRIRKYIGAYAAAMGGVDIILFTGGVGENQYEIRGGSLEGLEFLGVKLDKEKNLVTRSEEAVISAPDSPVTVCVIPTDEEMMIASDTLALVQG